jgi:hypothetical protein
MMQEHRSQASHAPASQPTQCAHSMKKERRNPLVSNFEFEINVINVL